MQKELTIKKYSFEDAKGAGIPVFNDCNLDVSFQGDNFTDHRVEPMGDDRNGLALDPEYPNKNRGIYALIAHSKVQRDER